MIIHCSMLSPSGQVNLVLALYKNLGAFLTTQNSTLRMGLGIGQGTDVRRRSLVVNSHVISASVHRGSNRVYLSEPVIFTLRHLQVCPKMFKILYFISIFWISCTHVQISVVAIATVVACMNTKLRIISDGDPDLHQRTCMKES